MVIRNFSALNRYFFLKSHSEIWPEKFFPSPQTQCQVSAHGQWSLNVNTLNSLVAREFGNSQVMTRLVTQTLSHFSLTGDHEALFL